MDIALGMADATKESEARKALKRYLMLKAVLIKPVRSGAGSRNRNINLAEKTHGVLQGQGKRSLANGFGN